jgi:hypothetical protein
MGERQAVRFRNKLVEEKVREVRDNDDGREITTEDTDNICSILITETREIREKNNWLGFFGSAPWESTGTCFNMRLPEMRFRENELPEDIDVWREDMGTIGIKTCYFNIPVSVDYLLALPELTELYLGSCHDIQDWSFIEKLPNLEMVGLLESGNGDNAVKHLASLKSLDNLIMHNMDVTDLTPFEGKRFSELNLYNNKIANAKPLGNIRAHYMKLANNLIEDIDSVNAVYLLDLRNNRIKSVKNLIESGSLNHLGRLFLEGNELPDEEKAEIREKHFVVCEL